MIFTKINGMTLKIDRAGRIGVPKPIRDRLGLRVGVDLEISEGPQGILIRRRTEPQPRMVKRGRLLVHTGKLPRGYDLSHAVEADREDRVREIWSR
jgi:AbrB family looped-hinge helix DNA binding protein